MLVRRLDKTQTWRSGTTQAKLMQTIITQGYAEQTINKSRFLAWAAACQTEREVAMMLRAIASQHANASHLAYAFRIKTPDGVVPRFSDAGEPSGTAGKPILQMLDGRDYINVCIGVIRYYGGINLGTGGLVRAYGSTAKLALEAAQTAEYVEMTHLELTIPYNQMDAITKALAKCNGAIVNKTFNEAVTLEITLPEKDVAQIRGKFGSR